MPIASPAAIVNAAYMPKGWTNATQPQTGSVK